MIRSNRSPPPGFWPASAELAEPSWYSTAITSSSSSPTAFFVLSSSIAEFTEVTGSRKSRPVTPSGETRDGVSCVPAPTTATFTEPAFTTV